MRSYLIAGAVVTFAAPAALAPASPAAAQEGCAFDYPAYEFSVPHIDLDECPEGVADGHFCRASIAGDMLHIFVFEEDEEQCLAELMGLQEGAFEIVLQ
ncbi:hypothetical protein BH23PSE1_BH23PSE1_10690 [soil metagenome]